MRASTLNAILFTSMSKTMRGSACLLGVLALAACDAQDAPETGAKPAVAADYVLTADQTHNKFSAAIPPVLTVPSGAVIEAYTQEATGGQLALGSTVADMEVDLVFNVNNYERKCKNRGRRTS